MTARDTPGAKRQATGAIVPEELIPEPRRSIRREQAAARDTPAVECDIVLGPDDWPGVHWCRTHKQTSDRCRRDAPEGGA